MSYAETQFFPKNILDRLQNFEKSWDSESGPILALIANPPLILSFGVVHQKSATCGILS